MQLDADAQAPSLTAFHEQSTHVVGEVSRAVYGSEEESIEEEDRPSGPPAENGGESYVDSRQLLTGRLVFSTVSRVTFTLFNST